MGKGVEMALGPLSREAVWALSPLGTHVGVGVGCVALLVSETHLMWEKKGFILS